MKQEKRIFGKIFMGLALFFFYAPILFMMVFSFNSSKSLTRFTGFSLRWYQTMLKNHDMMESLYITIACALLATIISTVIGTITAIGLSKSKKIVRQFVEQVNDFPLMNPEIVTAIGLMLLFITFQIDRGFMTLLLAHVAFCIPYVMLSVMPKIRSTDPNLIDAALDLGCTPFQALTKVLVPQIMPGIVSGALIAFTMSFDDFIISYFVTGHGVKNLSIMVYTMSKRVNPSVNAISTVVVVLITIMLIIINVVPMFKKNKPSNPKSSWKKLVAVVACVAVVFGLFSFSQKQSEKRFAGQTLHIYLPGEYIGENIVDMFQEETGAKLVMDNFDSNEQMYIKVANGEKYDLLIPSDYMIERLMQEDFLQPLDETMVDEITPLINESILDPKYDPGNQYTIPYFWGSVGIVYDTTVVDEKDLEKEGFGIFHDTKYKGEVYLYDSERDSMMMALKNLGYSMNTNKEEELNAAYDWLVQVVETMDAEIVTDEIIDNMAAGRKALGIVYSGDGAYIMSENEDMGYFEPKEGTNIWVDAMCIPKNAANPELANEFIRFITQYDPAMDNSDYIGYTSPNVEVAATLYGEGGTYEGISAYVPREGYENDESFGYDAQARKIIANLWARVKVVASNAG